MQTCRKGLKEKMGRAGLALQQEFHYHYGRANLKIEVRYVAADDYRSHR